MLRGERGNRGLHRRSLMIETVGRGLAEWIVHGGFRTLDLSPFGYDRIVAGRPIREENVV